MKLKTYLDNFAVVISDVVDADVIIVNSKMNIVGSRFKYFSLYNDIKYGSLISDVITNNRPLGIFDKLKVDICKKCPQFRECKMKGFIGVPIHYGNKVIGAISLILTKSRAKELFDKFESTMTFMENMAELVAIRVNEHEINKNLKVRVELVESIINAMQDALVYTDCYGNIIYTNLAFNILFNIDNKSLVNLKEIYPDIIKLYKKSKNLEIFKLSISNDKYSFYGTVSCVSVADIEEGDLGFICCFRTYKDIYRNSIKFSNGTMVTFSWLNNYLKSDVIDEAKSLSEKDEDILIISNDNALNELLAKAVVNYSERRFGEIKVIYMQNVYRDLLHSFFFAEYGVLNHLKDGTLIIVQPEMMSMFIQDKLADYMLSRRRIDDNVRFIFCTTSDIEKLTMKNLFSKKLYNLILINTINNTETLKNDYILFSKFIRSGLKYYNSIYNKKNNKLVDNIQKNMWLKSKELDLGMLELMLEKTVRSGVDDLINDDMFENKEKSLNELEYQYIKRLLLKGKTKGDISRIMGISRSTLYRKIKKYNLEDFGI